MAKVVSIEVGYSFIRICEMDYQVKNPKVYHHVTVPTPPNVIEDGYLKESANLRGVIKKALANNQITTKKVIFTVASSKILNREVLVPNVKANQIGNLIKANLAEYFPIDLTGYSVSHVLLETLTAGPDAGKSRVLIVAAERDMIQGYANLASSCGMQMIQLDFVGNSIYQAVKKEVNKDSVMILKIEENQTIITVVKDNNLMLLRSVNYGVGNLIKEVHHNNIFNVPDEEEAWTLLKRRGIVRVAFDENTRVIETDLEHDDTPQYAEARRQITAGCSALVNSIMRVISFYNSRNEEPINKMYIIGMGGEVSNLTKLFTNETGIPTAVFRRLEGIGWHQSVGDSELFGYVSCVGATLNSVSFVEQEKKGNKSKAQVNYIPIALGTGVCCLAIAGVVAFLGLKPYRDALDKKDELQQKEKEYEPAERLYKQCNAVTEFYNQIMLGHEMTKNENENILKFLDDLENVLPADAEVSQFISNQDVVEVTITVANKEEAALLISKFRDFESVEVVSVGAVTEENEDLDLLEDEEEQNTNEEAQEEEEEEGPELELVEIDEGVYAWMPVNNGGKVTFKMTGTYKKVLPEVENNTN